jgi:hypothetical protein
MEIGFRPTEIVEVRSATLTRLEARRAEHYLRGPIRMTDIQEATKLGGSCLAVLLVIHHRQVVTKREAVTLPSGLLSKFGIDKSAKWRALQRLELAQLIRVKRIPGKTAVIELTPWTKRKSPPFQSMTSIEQMEPRN